MLKSIQPTRLLSSYCCLSEATQTLCIACMANLTKACIFFLLLVVISSPFFMVSESRILKENPSVHKYAKSAKLLQKLGFDVSKLKKYETVSMVDRRSPGGPDSQHH